MRQILGLTGGWLRELTDFLDFGLADLIKLPLSGIIGFLTARFKRGAAHVQRELAGVAMRSRGWGIERIEDPKDPRIGHIADLLHRRLDANLVDQAHEIARWIREYREGLRRGFPHPHEYLLAATEGDKVTGCLFGHYYVQQRMLFISYLVRERRHCVDLGTPAEGLLAWLAREFGPYGSLVDCQGIVFELEHPDGIKARGLGPSDTRQLLLEARARRRLFLRALTVRGWTAKEIGIPYNQPALSIDGVGYAEERLALFLADRRWPPTNVPGKLAKAEVCRVLAFVFDEVYHDSFLNDDPEMGITLEARQAFYHRMQSMVDRIVRRIPDEVDLL